MTSTPRIHIIGAGLSGLAAATTLEKAGYRATIIDGSSQVGGRVATTISSADHIFDHGFQVLLTAYPAVQEFLDTSALQLNKFSPGAIVYKDSKSYRIGDALRSFSFLFPSLWAPVGSLKDKWLVFTLSRKLKQKSIEDIFNEPEQSTLSYLKEKGFSDRIITSFFKPFYGGIFLENQLQTSSRMFEFVFKMFAEGHAAIPARGMEQIPIQMASHLNSTLVLDTKVNSVSGNSIQLDNGTTIESDYIIIATSTQDLVSNMDTDIESWHHVETLYFKTNSSHKEAIIGLMANLDGLCNNFHFLHDVFEHHDSVISITVVKDHQLSKQELVKHLTTELKEHAGIDLGELLHYVKVPKALPQIPQLQYNIHPTETQLTQHLFLAGDHLSNASINAALLNGKAAANAVISKIENRPVF